MSLQEEITSRGVEEILHFTTNRGLVGMLATGFLKSRRRLPEDKYLKHILHPNAMVRPESKPFFDRSEDWLDFVNLSITEINTSFFRFSGDWSHNQEVWWAILAFDASIASHEGVYFATTNNGYEHCVRGKGERGFQQLFVNEIRRKGAWKARRGRRPERLPTCEQAEVLYPKEVPLSYLRAIYLRSPEHADCVRGWLQEAWLQGFDPDNVQVQVSEAKFSGAPN